MEPAIEADGLVKTYPKGVTALDGLSFAVAPGSVFALLGPNGAGKSTAVKILTTLATPDAGRATVAGIDVIANPDHVRRTIGVVAQGSARRHPGHRPREPAPPGADLWDPRPGRRGARPGAARAVRPRRRRRPDRAGLLRGDAAAPRHRDGARPRPGGAVPRRADHRARSRGPRRHVGRDRAAFGRAGEDRAADHALPGGGRPARRAGRDRRPRQGGRRREPPTSSSASCAATRSTSIWSASTTAR